jgi:hypothetical protein
LVMCAIQTSKRRICKFWTLELPGMSKFILELSQLTQEAQS